MKITGFSNFNISGLCKVEFTLAKNVQDISSPDENHEVIVSLKSGAEFIELYFTKKADDCVINQKSDDSGEYYEAKIKLINPKLEASKAATFKSYEQKDIIVIMFDNNDNKILIGSPDMPARMQYKLSIPGAGRNQRSINIDALHDQEPYFVTTEAVIIGGGFSSGFSSGFRI